MTVCNFPGIDFPGNRFDAVRIAFLCIRGMLLGIDPFPDELTAIFEPAKEEKHMNEIVIQTINTIIRNLSLVRPSFISSVAIKSICNILIILRNHVIVLVVVDLNVSKYSDRKESDRCH